MPRTVGLTFTTKTVEKPKEPLKPKEIVVDKPKEPAKPKE